MTRTQNTRSNRARFMAALKTLGVGGFVVMMVIGGAVMPAMADTQDAGMAVDDTYSTTTEFESVYDSGASSSATLTNDSISLDGDGSGAGRYVTTSDFSADEVTIDITSTTGTVQLIGMDGSGSMVDSATTSSSGSLTIGQDSTTQIVNWNVAVGDGSADGTAEINSYTVTSSASGEVSGTVTDADGNAVESATVSVVDVDGNEVASVPTDASGAYTVSSLADGDYDLTVTHADYNDATKTVTVSGGSAVTADFSMSVPTTGVEVSAFAMEDTDDDGTNEEVVVEGATVEVYDTSDTLVDSGTTDTNGVYTAEVAAGDYTVVTAFDDESNEQSVTVTDGAVNSISVEFADATDSSSGDNGGSIVDTAEENASLLGIAISVIVVLGFAGLLYRDM